MTGLFLILAYLVALLTLQSHLPWLPWLILVLIAGRFAYKWGIVDMSKYRKLTNFDEITTKLGDSPKEADNLITEEHFAKLKAITEEHIFGQDLVVNQIVNKIQANLEVPDRDRPILTALLVGPPGVGKSKLAEYIGKATSSHPQGFFCIDSSQYKDHDASSLFGTGKGYIGSDSPGSLTNWLKSLSGQVGTLCVDEVTRVSGNIQLWIQAFMPVISGKVTEVSTQQEFSTRNILVFFTTNYEQEKLSAIAERYHALQGKMPQAELEAAMRKEACAILKGPVFPDAFLDRIDVIGLYRPLNYEVMGDIVLKEAAVLTERHGMELEEIEAEVVVEAIRVAQAGDSTGARDFKRWVEQWVNPALLEAKRQRAWKVKLLLGPDRKVYATITAYRQERQPSSQRA